MLLAVAIAALPASIGIANAAPAATAVVSAEQAVPDCDHHHNVAGDQTRKTADGGARLAGCALCFVVVATDVSGVVYSALTSAALMPVRLSSNHSSLMGSPPFRPPRS
jgi:hypothetical protein